jgi:3-deoxy-D-manno-oct-2-ulosonic acid (Kdo) hydroxylase
MMVRRAWTATLETIEITRWGGPFPEAERTRVREALERGRVLYFPNLAFELAESEGFLLSPTLADGRAKNISLDPASGSLRGTRGTDRERQHLQAMMEAFAAAATRLVSDLFPGYAANLERARTSYRPVEIAGRQSSRLKDDALLHVDAFPSTPTRGRRILRFFSNINPSGRPRIWRIGEPFQDFAQRFLPSLGRPFGGGAWLLAAVGATKGRRSAYDQLMLRLHNAAKRNLAYQQNAPQIEVAFPAGASWLCFTDQVLHAALAGQYALEQTFYLDTSSMADPACSPVRELERMTQRQLQ